MKRKTVAVRMLRTHYPHWGQHTAFNAFLPFFDRRAFDITVKKVPLGNGRLLPAPISRFIWQDWQRKKPHEYGWKDFLAEGRLLNHALFAECDILHFIDAEHSLAFLPGWFQQFRRLKKFPKIIAMFHQPPAILERIIRVETASRVDHVLTVAPEQAEYFARFMPLKRLSTILLGVDTEYFKPLATEKDSGKLRCLAGGVWLRDYPAIFKTAALLAGMPEIEFHLVAPSKSFPGSAKNIIFHSGISDPALKELYQNCHVLFLPLQDATANTFLLEGSACGLPIVSSDLPALRAYFPGAEAMLIKDNDPQAFAQVLLELLRNPERRSRMSRSARQRALQLSWAKIVPEYERLYRELAGK